MTPTKVIRDGKVAVLVSPGYGAGWSSWHWDDEVEQMLLFDRAFVEAKEQGVTAIVPIMKSVFGDGVESYDGGWLDTQIVWLKQGTKFLVEENDGYETLITDSILNHTAYKGNHYA